MAAQPFDPRARLEELRARHLYRRRRVVQEWPAADGGATAVVDGVKRLVFCSNDYLGLAHHPKLIEAFQTAAARGVGGGAAHLVTGHSAEHHALEEELANFTGRQRALLFSTGYMANLGVASTLLGRGDCVLQDRLNHASLLDAGLISGARFMRYPHADAAAAELQLTRPLAGASLDASAELRGHTSTSSALVMTDGVFSMDGDIAPLRELATVATKHHAWLMVDDAHGIGVLGARGRGTLDELQLDTGAVPILMGTLGKALGTAGAFVAGDEDLIELMIQKSRTYIYTTAMPPAVAAASRAALRLIDAEPWRRTKVLEHVQRFRRGIEQTKLPLRDSRTPIQPIVLGSAARALAASEALWERGIWVTAIRPPTVPEDSARLRITFSAAHTERQVDQLVETLAETLSRLP